MAINKNKVMEGALKLAEKGAYDKAVKEYLKVVQEDPKDVRVWLKIGDLYAKKGAKQEATDTYLKVAELYTEQGFFLKAVAVFKQVLKLDPRLIDVNLKLAQLYKQLQLPAEAMAQFEYVATFCHREGNSAGAVEALRQILEIDPNNVATRIKLAELYSKEGLSKEAIVEFTTVANNLRAAGRQDDFVKVAERLVWHQPDNRLLNRELAEIYIKRGDPRRALQKLQACFKADPRDVETLHLLAGAFEELGQTAKTISVLKELARIHQENGHNDKRLDVLRRIGQLAPDDTEVRAAFGGGATSQRISLPPTPPAPPQPPPQPQYQMPPPRTSGLPPLTLQASSGAPSQPMGMTGSMPIVTIEEALGAPRVATPMKGVPGLPGASDMPPAGRAPMMPPRSTGAGTGGHRAMSSQPPIQLEEELVPDDEFGYDVSGQNPAMPGGVFEDDPSRQNSADDFTEEVAKVLAEADVYVKYGLHQKAIDHVRPILARDGRNVEAHEKLKEVYLKLGRYDEAATALAALVEITGSARSEVAATFLGELAALIPGDERVRALAERFMLPLPDAEMALDARGSEPAPLEPPGGQRGKRPDTMGYGDEFSDDIIVAEAEAEPEADMVVEVPPLDHESGNFPKAARQATATLRQVMPVGEHTLDEDGEGDGLGDPSQFDSGLVELEPEAADAGGAAIGVATEAPSSETQSGIAAVGADDDGGSLEDDLDEADFFVQQNLYGEARNILEALLARYPNHPLVQAKLQDVEALASVGEAEAPPAPAPASARAPEPERVYQLTQPRSVVAKLGDDDVETHYDLGIAYKEMGLFDDAIKEFQVVMQLPGRAVQCAMMIGLCYAEMGQHSEAINQYKQALYEPQITEREALALYFELGQSYERLSDGGEALYYYEKVAKRDPRFREVGKRMSALRDKLGDGAGKPRSSDA